MTETEQSGSDGVLSDTIAIVVPESESQFFSEDVYLSLLIEGAAARLAKSGKQLMLLLSPTHEVYERTRTYLIGGHVDGVIIASLHSGDTLPQELRDAGVPVVTSGRSLEPLGVPFVDVDHKLATRAAVLYLFGTGRFKVATIAGPLDMVAGVERLAGYVAAMGEHDSEPVVAQGDFTRESGFAAMEEILGKAPETNAVFCASDLMAAGAIDTIHQAGKRVPQDIAVIGFDDIKGAQHMSPPLTTVRQPIREFGSALAQQVVGLAAGNTVNDAIMLPTELIVREST